MIARKRVSPSEEFQDLGHDILLASFRPTGLGNGPSNGTFTATIDGTNWSATFIAATMAQVSSGGASGFGASSPTYTMGFAWIDQGPGTYTVGQSIGFNGTLTQGSSQWTTSAPGGTGTLTVTNRTASQISGTFSFSMVPSSGTSGTRTVTNGAFNVTF